MYFLNRVETSHSTLKRQLQSSRGTSEALWTKSHALVELRHTEIKASLERSSGPDPLARGCVVRYTHGIPCAHEIVGYKHEERPIPLSSIHPYWKKLYLLPSTTSNTTELSCSTELEMILKRFNNNDYTRKLQILKKLKELANPA